MDRNTLIGLTTGAAFMFGFGIIWLLLGLFRGRSSPKWVHLVLLAAGICLGLAVLSLGQRASHAPAAAASAQQSAADREISRHFYMIFGAELIAIFVAVVVLRMIHYPDYILAGIAIIVGVHFVPLASLFRFPVFYVTGLLGCVIGVMGFLISDAGLRQKVVGLSFGLMLWATALWIVWTGLSAAPRVAATIRWM